MELGERKSKILAAVIESYIATGDPIGSKVLCDILDFSVSSATIRNEMSELVEIGLLEQPHTSAGRVPTNIGYRFYINNLMEKKPITSQEKQFIRESLSANADAPEHLLEQASQVLAKITKLAAISTTPPGNGAKVSKINFVQTGRRTAMMVMMVSTGMVKNKLFRCDYDLTPEILKIFHNVLNEKFSGLDLENITPAFIQTVAASFGGMTMLMPSVLIAVLEASREAVKADVCIEGQMNLLFCPEFEICNIRGIIEFLNSKNDITELLFSVPRNTVNVLIGEENDRKELRKSSLIIAKYGIDVHNHGVIGIIGPTRIDYSRMISNIEYLANTVSELLGEIVDAQ